MKRIWILLTVVLLSQAGFSQSLERSVISSVGGSWTNGSTFAMDYTVGEVMVSTLNSANNFLTQGFQQPFSTMVVSVPEESSEQALIYPNPVVSDFQIQLVSPDQGDYQVMVYDMLGQLVSSSTTRLAEQSAGIITTDVSSFSTGNYFVRVVYNQQLVFSGKIIKIQQ